MAHTSHSLHSTAISQLIFVGFLPGFGQFQHLADRNYRKILIIKIIKQHLLHTVQYAPCGIVIVLELWVPFFVSDILQ